MPRPTIHAVDVDPPPAGDDGFSTTGLAVIVNCPGLPSTNTSDVTAVSAATACARVAEVLPW
jgi:hypothetical protein